MTAELTDPRSPDPGAAAVHLLDAPAASAVVRRPRVADLTAPVGWGVLVLPVFGADPELSVEFSEPAGEAGGPAGPRWLACADLRRIRHDVVAVRGLLRAGPALTPDEESGPEPPEGAAHRVQGVFRMRPLPGRRIQIVLHAVIAAPGAAESRGGPVRLEFTGAFVR
ncbi:hypothetical protein [Pseudonocardia xishanensis]|uniref:Lipoprotein LpqN n=1 Tax=Pseudonocardia xishanensis TaxID=630995 RepID=A0ABP8RCT8_9PSEU